MYLSNNLTNTKMKKTTLLLTFLMITLYSTSQGLYPKGCYMSFEEVKSKSPSENYQLTIEKRTKSEIKMNGGNDYQLVSTDKSVKRKVLKKEIFAYSDGDTLYINCLKYLLQSWYSQVISDGRYLVFIAGIPMLKDMQSKALQQDVQMSVMFGAVGGAFAGAELAMRRYLYIVDKELNVVKLVNQEVVKEVLKDSPHLLEQYNLESKPNETDIQVKYLKLVNSSL